MTCCNANGCGTEFDGLKGILDLEQSSFGRESAVRRMVREANVRKTRLRLT